MTSALATAKSVGRAAVVAGALSGLGLATAPAAQAQSFSFHLGVGDSGNVMSFGVDSNNYGNNHYHPIKKCLSDWQVRQGVESYGFNHVQILDHLSHHQVAAQGYWKSRLYAMKVDACSGEVYDVARVRNQGNGFGFQFSIGN